MKSYLKFLVRGNMKKYFKILINQVLIGFNYRFNLVNRFILYIFSIMVNIFLWQGVYVSSGNEIISGYTKKEMIIYILIANLIHYICDFKNLTRLGNLVHTGKFSMLLIRPISIIKESFFYHLGENIIKLGFFFMLITMFSKNIFSYNYLLTIILFILVFLMSFYLMSVLSCLGFWMLETWPLVGLLNGIYFITSGTYFPLDVLPMNIFRMIKYNPFGIIVFGLTKTIQSSISINETISYIVVCILWIILFRTMYFVLLKKGIKTYEGMGA